MRSHRIPARDVVVGDVLLTVNGRDHNRRVNEVTAPPVGMPVRGPRGGRYALTASGAASMVVLHTAGGSPVVRRDAAVTVLRDDPTDV